MSELKPPVRAAAYVAALGVVLALALGIGRLVGPLDVEAATSAHGDTAAHESTVSGLAAAVDGYRMVLDAPVAAAGTAPLTFSILGADERALRDYDVSHERDLHLIVVRRDLTGFQHVHPTLDEATGAWTTPVDLTPGAWRVIADFVPDGGEQVVLGADLLVAGADRPTPLGDDDLGTSVDGYDVTLGASFVAGAETELVTTVYRDGEPVTDLEPYLGELGHLVILREGDLGYVHGHPGEAAGSGPTIRFATTFPSAGRYRLFAEFQHGGSVHAAVFTATVAAGETHERDHGAEGDEGADHDH